MTEQQKSKRDISIENALKREKKKKLIRTSLWVIILLLMVALLIKVRYLQ
jgi:hypothetical protein